MDVTNFFKHVDGCVKYIAGWIRKTFKYQLQACVQADQSIICV